VIIADLVENGLSLSDIVVIPDGSFRRNYSSDIAGAEVLKLDNGQKLLGIHINRDSLYDELPEALFHDQPVQPLSSGHEMANLSKKQKQEEKKNRLFFLPFENEIFYHRVTLELEERKILNRFSENLFDDIYPHFWNLDRNLPKKLLSRLILVLHYSHKIVGNKELTEKILGIILEEEVEINILRRGKHRKNAENNLSGNSPPLRSCMLGVDFICGEYVPDSDPSMEFVIGPLKNSSVEDYLENGSYAGFLECFYGFFVPVEMDVITTIKVSESRQKFNLNGETPEAILGYNTVI
jgi:hypothetical protein